MSTPHTDFGAQIAARAQELRAAGKDANQIADILFQADAAGRNYGIGIILDGQGRPAPTSPTLLAAAAEELAASAAGSYRNSAARLEDLKTAVLAWQRIPEELAPHFRLAVPSDAGTGAVLSALQALRLLAPTTAAIGVEERSWPAYKTIAKVLGLGVAEEPLGAVVDSDGVIPVYQAGPHNATGRVPRPEEMRARAAAGGGWLLLDRAYPGFEYARGLGASSYDDVMRMSYLAQLKPFIDAGRPFMLALSPTKAFVTFALRPCGLLLAYCPDGADAEAAQGAFNAVLRARGSSFEHPLTRAFVDALIDRRGALEQEHAAALRRLGEAELAWRRHAKGTALETAFNDDYAGLFRNVAVTGDAPAALYGEHLYPVFTPGRCRLNVSGLPNDPAAAEADVKLFARYCRA